MHAVVKELVKNQDGMHYHLSEMKESAIVAKLMADEEFVYLTRLSNSPFVGYGNVPVLRNKSVI